MWNILIDFYKTSIVKVRWYKFGNFKNEKLNCNVRLLKKTHSETKLTKPIYDVFLVHDLNWLGWATKMLESVFLWNIYIKKFMQE